MSKSTLRPYGARSLIPQYTIIPLIRYESYPYLILTTIVPQPQIVVILRVTRKVYNHGWRWTNNLRKEYDLTAQNILYAIAYDSKILKPYDRYVENTWAFIQDRIFSVLIVHFTSDDGLLYPTRSTLTLILIWPLNSFRATLTLIWN